MQSLINIGVWASRNSLKNRCQKLQQRKGIKAKGINMDDIDRKPVDGKTTSDSVSEVDSRV